MSPTASGEAAQDSDLVRRAARGDTEAFERLVELHADAIAAVVSSILGLGHADVPDATQETFIRAYENMHRCRQPERVRSWLVRIAQNICRDRMKTPWWRRVALVASPPETGLSSPCDVDFIELDSALRSLPEERRLLLLLRYYYGYSLAQVGEMTGLQPEAVRSRIRRSLNQLRGVLGSDWEASDE